MPTDLGDVHRLHYEHTDLNGNAATAGSMALTITLPDATTTVVSPVTPVSQGRYQHDFTTTQAGRHTVRWVGTGANPGAHVDTFDVQPSTPTYLVSLADAKEHLNIPPSDKSNDDELRGYLGAATRAVERHRNEVIVRRTVTEYLNVGTTDMLVLRAVPVISVTSVGATDASRTWNVNDLQLDASGGILARKVGSSFNGAITVTYTAGYTIIPEHYVLAAKIIVAHLWETQRGSAGAPRIGEDRILVGSTVATFSIPRRALELLGDAPPVVA